MMTLFNDEYILKSYVESQKKEAAILAAQKLHKKGNSVEDIADVYNVSAKEVEEWLGLIIDDYLW